MIIMIKIYKITNVKNGKVYVGQTSKSLENRFAHHKTQKSKIGSTIRSEGESNFIIEEAISIENDNQEMADEFEMLVAKRCDAFENGYNVKKSKGKCGGDTLSNHPDMEKISKKISESKMGDKNPMRIYGGLKGERNGMYGKPSINRRTCRLTDSVTGEVRHFDSLKDCQDFLGCKSVSPIFNRCNHKVDTPFMGYLIEYDDGNE